MSVTPPHRERKIKGRIDMPDLFMIVSMIRSAERNYSTHSSLRNVVELCLGLWISYYITAAATARFVKHIHKHARRPRTRMLRAQHTFPAVCDCFLVKRGVVSSCKSFIFLLSVAVNVVWRC